MVIYEVNLYPELAIEAEFHEWLRAHVQQMLKLPGFTGADVYFISEPEPPMGCAGICCQYTLADQAALDAYLANHATAMREDGQRRFGGRFTASRRVLSGEAL